MSISIIPAIDIIDGHCVRLSQGDYGRCTVYDARPDDMVRRFIDAGLTRIHVVDLEGAKASQPKNLATLERIALVDGAQIEWGGGLKSEQSLKDIFNAGATYAVIGSLAAKNPPLMAEWTRVYTPERMVLGADARDGKIAVNGWLEGTELTVSSLLDQLAPSGLRQVICTDIACDGMLKGPSYDLYRQLMAEWPDMIFTASGGIGSMEHIERLDRMGMPRVIVGKALYEGKVTLQQLTNYILNH